MLITRINLHITSLMFLNVIVLITSSIKNKKVKSNNFILTILSITTQSYIFSIEYIMVDRCVILILSHSSGYDVPKCTTNCSHV